MKRWFSSRPIAERTACLLVLVAAVTVVFPESATGQTQFTWSSTAATDTWGTAGNWAGGAAPTSTGTIALSFGATSGSTTLVNNVSSLRIHTFTFLPGAPAYTLTGSNYTITGSNQPWAGGGYFNLSTNKQTLNLSGANSWDQFRTVRVTAGGGDFEFAGNVIPFHTSGTGTIFLSGSVTGGSANTSTTINANTQLVVTSTGGLQSAGSTVLAGGTLTLQTDAPMAQRTIGAGSSVTSTLIIDRATPGAAFTQTSGTLALGAGTLRILAGNNVTSGTAAISFAGINLSNGALSSFLLDPQTAVVSVSGTTSVALNPLTGGYKNLNLGGITAGNQISGPITDGLSPVSLTKSGTGSWTLSGSNSFSGALTVSDGRLNVTQSNGLSGIGVRRQLVSGANFGVLAVAVSGSGTTLNFQGVANNVITLAGTSSAGVNLINDDVANAATLDNGIAGISFTGGGTGFTLANRNQPGVITLSDGGAAAQITSLGGSLDTLTLVTGGTGYAVNNIITLSGGLGSTSVMLAAAAVYRVTSVGANGQITGLAVQTPGIGYVGVPTGFTAAKGTATPSFTGTGASFTFNNNFAAAEIQTTAVGTGYTVAPTVGTTTGSGLVATATLSSLALTGTNNRIGGAGAMTINSVISGTGRFAKVGGGRLTLSASNSFTGATRISEGILEIGSTGRINTTSGITIDGTTAEFRYNSAAPLTQPITFTQGTISGTGTIATAVTVGTSDVISPGNSPGTQAYTSLHAWSPGGTYRWELNSLTGSPGVNWDLVNVTSGTFSLAGLSTTPGNQFVLDLITLGAGDVAGQLVTPYDGGSYTFAIASYAPANFLLPGGFSNIAGTDLTSLFTINLGNWQGAKPQLGDVSVKINSTASGIDVVIVPEPQALALAGIGIAAAWAYRRRRSTP
jgi:autotransporter-associated beta strand protein